MHFRSFLTWWSGFIFQQHVINTKTFASLPLKPPTKIQVTPDLASSHPPKIAYPMTSTIEIEKKKQSATLDFLRSTLKPFKEPSGTMWHDVVFRFPVSRFLELESAGGVQPAYTPHSDTQFLANQNPGKTDMESYKVLVWRNLEKPIIFSDLLVWCFSISVTQCLTWMTKLWLLKYPWNSTWSRFVWWINVYFWKKGPRHGNDLNKKWSFM